MRLMQNTSSTAEALAIEQARKSKEGAMLHEMIEAKLPRLAATTHVSRGSV